MSAGLKGAAVGVYRQLLVYFLSKLFNFFVYFFLFSFSFAFGGVITFKMIFYFRIAAVLLCGVLGVAAAPVAGEMGVSGVYRELFWVEL